MGYTCGEEPGKGTYKCNPCGETVTLDDDTDKLPPCPRCEKCDYSRVQGTVERYHYHVTIQYPLDWFFKETNDLKMGRSNGK